METILLVEDESAIADTVIYSLQTEGFKTHWCSLGKDALSVLQVENDIALIILDIGLPDANGFDICKQIRKFSEIPIIFLTARNDEIDRVVGLEIGADDYISKPFSPRELCARVKVILKRVQKQAIIESNKNYVIDELRACIFFHEQALDLTRYEYLIFRLLLQRPQRVYSREQIMSAVWTEPETSLDRVVDTHIKIIRNKIRMAGGDAECIKTHRGLGYSFNDQTNES